MGASDREIEYKLKIKTDKEDARSWEESFKQAAAGVGRTLSDVTSAAIAASVMPGASFGGNFSQFAAARAFAEAEAGIGRGVGEFAGGFFGKRGEKVGGFVGEKIGKIAGEATQAEIEMRERPIRDASAMVNQALGPAAQAGASFTPQQISGLFGMYAEAARRVQQLEIVTRSVADAYQTRQPGGSK